MTLRKSVLGSLLLLATTISLSNAAAEIEKGFTPMFNGKDLTGWEGLPGAWGVVDGAITSNKLANASVGGGHPRNVAGAVLSAQQTVRIGYLL